MAKMLGSNMYCVICGNKGIPVQRIKGRERELGHLKKLYCLHCKKETNMVEVRENSSHYTYEDFKFEFEHHNFDAEGNRIKKINELRKEVKDEELLS